MKKFAFVVLVAFAGVPLSAQSATKATGEQIDEITLAYLNAKVYARGAVVCNAAVVNSRSYIGCANSSLDGRSLTQLWLLDQNGTRPRYLAVNGTARGTYDRHFSANRNFGAMPLPLSRDVAIDAALNAVK
ncbi:hypothetical protein [Burkholderia lata]|uniref:hypothetical protein n=1 Tax=Burkholderia lata (strain ATCC 17760 / DSM 23089 / LMG 22485 / NCIMB 9086 / R18194 / 383) TaxID=482957 RepID=UPI00399B03BA